MADDVQGKAREVPDYVVEFKRTKPPNTEVKCVKGHYYLYERVSMYDKNRKRPVKVSGGMLGTITPDGLVPCMRRKPKGKTESRFEVYMKRLHPECLTETLGEKLAGFPEGQIVNTGSDSFKGTLVYERRTAELESEEKANEYDVNTDMFEDAFDRKQSSTTEHEKMENSHSEESNPCTDDSVEQTDNAIIEKSLEEHEENNTPADCGQRESDVSETEEQNQEFDKMENRELAILPNNQFSNSNSFVAKDDAIVTLEVGVDIKDFIWAAREAQIPPPQANDDVEIGAALYLISRTHDMRERLKKHFGKFWPIIYVIALIRTIYDKIAWKVCSNQRESQERRSSVSREGY